MNGRVIDGSGINAADVMTEDCNGEIIAFCSIDGALGVRSEPDISDEPDVTTPFCVTVMVPSTEVVLRMRD